MLPGFLRMDFFSWISSYSYRNTYHRKNIPLQSLTKFPVDGQVRWCLEIMAMTAIKIRSRCIAHGNRNSNKEREKLKNKINLSKNIKTKIPLTFGPRNIFFSNQFIRQICIITRSLNLFAFFIYRFICICI